jgi:hypothetical protein
MTTMPAATSTTIVTPAIATTGILQKLFKMATAMATTIATNNNDSRNGHNRSNQQQ